MQRNVSLFASLRELFSSTLRARARARRVHAVARHTHAQLEHRTPMIASRGNIAARIVVDRDRLATQTSDERVLSAAFVSAPRRDRAIIDESDTDTGSTKSSPLILRHRDRISATSGFQLAELSPSFCLPVCLSLIHLLCVP